jgi:hypothetical protein
VTAEAPEVVHHFAGVRDADFGDRTPLLGAQLFVSFVEEGDFGAHPRLHQDHRTVSSDDPQELIGGLPPLVDEIEEMHGKRHVEDPVRKRQPRSVGYL